MWRMREVLLNWVRTYICRRPELMQLEMGISTMRYLPARGTAGLDRSLVRGKSRLPAPPPMMIARVRCSMERSLLEVITRGGGERYDAKRRGGLRAFPVKKFNF